MSSQLPAISDCLVRESHGADSGRKIARLPPHMRDRLQITDDDRVVRLDGFDTTLVEAWPTLETQADDGVYLPKQVAADAGTTPLGRVTVEKVHPPVADEVVLRPATDQYLTWPGSAPDGAQDELHELPVMATDSFPIRGAGPVEVPVTVMSVTPETGGLITEATAIRFE